MIVSLSVANFRSFASEQTLSLVASNRFAHDHEDHTLPIPDCNERVLRTAVLYGANGAGKSNLFKAVQYMRNMARGSAKRKSGTGREIFRFGQGETTPSAFDLQFITNQKLYRFGFKVDDERVLEEWLAQVEGTKEKTIYERTTDPAGRVTIDAPGLKASGEKLKALATVAGPQNQTFLAAINLTLDETSRGEEINGILGWFKRGLTLISPDTSYSNLGDLLSQNSNFKTFAGEFLKSSSTGVDRLTVEKREITEEELRGLLPSSLLSSVLKDIAEDEDGAAVVQLGEGNEFVIERKPQNRFFKVSIRSIHEHEPGKAIPLELDEESDGTKRLLNLMPALHRFRNSSAVYFIDEIDRSLHPILVRHFLEFFLKSCEGGQRQIIVTTHESSLLDLDILRRDEIWFAEKDQNATTHLYSLSDFKVRKDLAISKHYMQGRFGAIPFIGNFEELLAKQECLE
jgi:uncharacterized protein